MKEAEAVELVETTPLQGLAELPTDAVYAHVDFLGRELPGPVDLYRRWERQHWSATAIDFGLDREQWPAIHPEVREQLEGTFGGFFFGEQAVTDTLSPLLLGAPDEESRLFLSTQVVDEARHSYFFARFYHDVLGVPGGLREALAQVGPVTDDRLGYGRLFHAERGELAVLTEAVRRTPRDRGRWVQAITVYHLMVEGVLALPSQRRVLRLLRAGDLLPGFRAGFTAVTRDESRHVSYGIWALRQAVAAGHAGDVRTVVDRTLPHCLHVFMDPDVRLPDPRDLPAPARIDPREQWTFVVDSLVRRLHATGMDPGYVTGVERRARGIIGDSVARYEQVHGDEHPARAWERGELQPAPGEPRIDR
jgi:ribonucleoside-diphosphate reductase beta chain